MGKILAIHGSQESRMVHMATLLRHERWWMNNHCVQDMIRRDREMWRTIRNQFGWSHYEDDKMVMGMPRTSMGTMDISTEDLSFLTSTAIRIESLSSVWNDLSPEDQHELMREMYE